jgi:glycosyltransferase involved in cell wall biosynthesis
MSRPIRVLELRSVRGTGGGPEKTILLGAARSDPARFAVTVCYIRDERDPVFSIDEKAAGLPVDYVELRERHSFDRRIWTALRALVRERQIDIVHAHEYKTDFLALLLSKFEPVIPLSTVHGWTGHSSREAWLYYPLDKWLLSRYPRLVAVSNDVRRELIAHGARPDRVTTVLNGIDYRAFHRDRSREATIRSGLRLSREDEVIGAVGRLEPQKRFDILIRAVGELRQSRPRVKLLIAGDGSLKESLAAQIAAAQLESSCALLGHRTDVADLHHAFDVFAQASDYEGTPNSVLEAMAFETPVVATDAGGTSDILRDGVDGVIVPSGNVTALATGIAAALSDPTRARERARSARHQVETVLSFDARMTSVETIYTELFEARGLPDTARPAPART